MPTFLEVLGPGYCRDDNGQNAWPQSDVTCQVELSDCRDRCYALGCACFAFGGYGHFSSANTCSPNGLGRCAAYLGDAFAAQSSGYAEYTAYGVRRGFPPAPPRSPPAPPTSPAPPVPPAPPLSPPAAALTTVDEIVAAVADATVPRIVIAPGVYRFTRDGCRYSFWGASAICILSRDLIIEAAVPGSVTLDAGGSDAAPRRMIDIYGSNSPTVELIGLVISGGHLTGSAALQADSVRRTPNPTIAIALPERCHMVVTFGAKSSPLGLQLTPLHTNRRF